MKQEEKDMLTKENIFDKETYRAIALILEEYGVENNGFQVRRLHLAHMLVKGCEKDYLKKYFKKSSTQERMLERLSKVYKDKGFHEDEKKNEEYYQKGKKYFEKNMYDTWVLGGLLPPKKPFPSKKSLHKAIDTMIGKRFQLVKSNIPKKGYSYLSLTDNGSILLLKWEIKHLVDGLDDRRMLLAIFTYSNDRIAEDLHLKIDAARIACHCIGNGDSIENTAKIMGAWNQKRQRHGQSSLPFSVRQNIIDAASNIYRLKDEKKSIQDTTILMDEMNKKRQRHGQSSLYFSVLKTIIDAAYNN